jgi:hypothetical protein
MASVRTKVDLRATFMELNIGDSVDIKLSEASEGTVRNTAHRLSREPSKKKFYASLVPLSGTIRVIRTA